MCIGETRFVDRETRGVTIVGGPSPAGMRNLAKSRLPARANFRIRVKEDNPVSSSPVILTKVLQAPNGNFDLQGTLNDWLVEGNYDPRTGKGELSINWSQEVPEEG